MVLLPKHQFFISKIIADIVKIFTCIKKAIAYILKHVKSVVKAILYLT